MLNLSGILVLIEKLAYSNPQCSCDPHNIKICV